MVSERLPPSITLSSPDAPLKTPSQAHYDTHTRMFIGPMPERVISQKEKSARGDRDEISEIIRRNAFSFFVRQGGRREDWGEDQERNVVEEMFQRWRSSEWGSIWRRRKESANPASASITTGHWVGGSFEIGRFLGVSMLHDDQTSASGSNVQRPSTSQASQRPSTGNETFVTAPTKLGLDTESGASRSSKSERRVSPDIGATFHTSSSTSLLRTVPKPSRANGNGAGARTTIAVPPRPALAQRLQGPLTHSDDVLAAGAKANGNGKGKAVHYSDSLPDQGPAPPEEVLDRTDAEDLQDTSAGAAAAASEPPDIPYPSLSPSSSLNWGDVFMRDRMLVRTYYTKSEDLNHHFDEQQHRTTRDLLDADWAEYLVAWRRDRIELYTDHVRERIVYSEDMRNPRVNTKVRIDIPPGVRNHTDRLPRIFHRDNIITLCTTSLASVPDWRALIEREIKEGKELQLAWRRDTNLDWIWLDDDVDGRERLWEVLYGFALRQASSHSPSFSSTQPPVLEIRLADHFPPHIHLKNGHRLHEPPAIEGYVHRIRPNTQTKQRLYLSTHDGNLFVLAPSHAYPPLPPGLAQNLQTDMESFAESLRKSEVHRGAMQIMHAIGVNDLRTILAIRRAVHPVPQAMHKEVQKSQDEDVLASIWAQPEERTPADEEDQGGEEGLDNVEDKVHIKMRRSFELLLKTGHVTHSCRDATEWIERLRALVLYWKQRHRMDAKEEMDLAQSRRPRLTPLTRVVQNEEMPPEAPPDMGAPMPALGSLYNWCVLKGCKSIVKGGKLFVRKGLWGQYKLVQLFLAAGHLTQFRIKPNSSLHQTMHRKTSLVDAYVCSGYLAAMALPKGQFRVDVNTEPRRYQDGLETNDPEEEMLFMIWYYPQGPKSEHKNEGDADMSKTAKSLPKLSGKRKLLVCRTRSRLERDAWCWALNCEIEKLVRVHKDREGMLRESGNLVPA
ncbi:hypothetical protein H0H92_015170 [Tricholoma furcatifolium]|nr:hypothetical protein H0H92_015170 [Tricholoma furcatifolium]